MTITKDTPLLEALRSGNTQAMANVLREFGMPCLGCALARHETVGQAASSHGIDVDTMVKALNEAAVSTD
ncbi:MAG TPA: DUF1858 domain-containing protein [Clostridia bacterium]|jgi:hybrid cluster-associated redox disulfide protein|nr:DUF1858 domain-containing protein [Clostridia bacterium]